MKKLKKMTFSLIPIVSIWASNSTNLAYKVSTFFPLFKENISLREPSELLDQREF